MRGERVWLLTWALVVAGCSPRADVARYTVEEYRADAELRHAQVERCRKDPGTLKNNPDCINAQAAATFEDRMRLRDAPPVGLGQHASDSKEQ